MKSNVDSWSIRQTVKRPKQDQEKNFRGERFNTDCVLRNLEQICHHMDKAVTEEHMSDEFYHVSLRKPSGYVSRFVSFFPKSSGFFCCYRTITNRNTLQPNNSLFPEWISAISIFLEVIYSENFFIKLCTGKTHVILAISC